MTHSIKLSADMKTALGVFGLILFMQFSLFQADVSAETTWTSTTWPSRPLMMSQSDPEPEESDDDSLEGFDDDEGSLEGFGDDEGDGFPDEPTVELDLSQLGTPATGGPMLTGFFREELAYAHEKDDPVWSKIRSVLNLSLEYKITDDWQSKIGWNGFYDYAFRYDGRDKYTDETLEDYETESEIRDLYLDGILTDWLRLKVGRQVIAWGESDGTQIVDLINPRDQRELGQVDIEDARMPVTAGKISLLASPWALDLVAIHEIRPNRTGGAGSDFDPYASLRSQGLTILDEEVPDSNFEHTEWLMRLSAYLPGGDVSLVWADVYDDSAYLDADTQMVGMAPVTTLTPKHKRITFVGASGNVVSGSFIWKGEVGKTFNKAIMRNDLGQEITNFVMGASSSVSSWTEKDLTKMMLGVDYTGITDLSITVEAVREEINGYQDNLLPDRITESLSVRASYSTLNETLNYNGLVVSLGDNNGSIVRLTMDYDIMDALEISGGLVSYDAVDEGAMLWASRKQDRIFTTLKYSF